ncbi:MAG TPA: GNAT family N-acetyltransferase, partial [Thermoleophilaceae bacterium]|nr:GNAT family N-acetyltransferase [Thermoleophilaceae bacterium]
GRGSMEQLTDNTRMDGPLGFEVLDGLDDAAGDWDRLAEAAGNVFSTREWASMWWRHFGAGRDLRLIACRDSDGSAVALLPLYLNRTRPLRVLRFVGHGPADQLGPVCAPADRERVAGALRGVLADRRWRADLLVGDRLGGAEGWAAMTGATVLLAEPSPTLAIDGRSWDDFLASRSKNFRDQVRRRERKLAKSHELAFRLSEAERLDEDMTTLLRLHSARWEDASAAFEPHLESFHRQFAAVALERGWLRLWLAEVDGKPVAAWYGLRYAGCESFYQSGRDPSWDSHSVGFVLLAHSIRSAFEDGLSEYRFLRGGDAYKGRFSDGDAGVETVLLGRGSLGRPAAAAAGALGRLPRGDRLLARASTR